MALDILYHIFDGAGGRIEERKLEEICSAHYRRSILANPTHQRLLYKAYGRASGILELQDSPLQRRLGPRSGRDYFGCHSRILLTNWLIQTTRDGDLDI